MPGCRPAPHILEEGLPPSPAQLPHPGQQAVGKELHPHIQPVARPTSGHVQRDSLPQGGPNPAGKKGSLRRSGQSRAPPQPWVHLQQAGAIRSGLEIQHGQALKLQSGQQLRSVLDQPAVKDRPAQAGGAPSQRILLQTLVAKEIYRAVLGVHHHSHPYIPTGKIGLYHGSFCTSFHFRIQGRKLVRTMGDPIPLPGLQSQGLPVAMLQDHRVLQPPGHGREGLLWLPVIRLRGGDPQCPGQFLHLSLVICPIQHCQGGDQHPNPAFGFRMLCEGPDGPPPYGQYHTALRTAGCNLSGLRLGPPDGLLTVFAIKSQALFRWDLGGLPAQNRVPFPG